MATFRCDIKQQYGKFSGFAWKHGEAAGAPVAKDEATAAGAIDAVVASLKTAGFANGDEVIFRENAYGSLGDLKGTLKGSRY